jgi:hypothetical protein
MTEQILPAAVKPKQAEEFDHAGFHVVIWEHAWEFPRLHMTYTLSYRRARSSCYGDWQVREDFSTVEKCRRFALAKVEEMAAETRAKSRETGERRRAERIAKIARDYLLLGKHIGNSLQCRICGRGLTDPVSISLAIGSECWPRLEDRLAAEVPRLTEKIAELEALRNRSRLWGNGRERNRERKWAS